MSADTIFFAIIGIIFVVSVFYLMAFLVHRGDLGGDDPVGWEACWKPTNRGNCRLPRDHSGDCL